MATSPAERSRRASARTRHQNTPTGEEKRLVHRLELRSELIRAKNAIDTACEHGQNETYITWDFDSNRDLAKRIARSLRRQGYHARVNPFSEDMGLVLSISW